MCIRDRYFPQIRTFVPPSLRPNVAVVPTTFNMHGISRSNQCGNYYEIPGDPAGTCRPQIPTTSTFISKPPKRAKRKSPDTVANPGRWTKEEHKLFLEGSFSRIVGVALHGKDWRKVKAHIGTRKRSQIRSHAQKYFANERKNLVVIPTDRGRKENLRVVMAAGHRFKPRLVVGNIPKIRCPFLKTFL
eukprot:TRINITY_DN4582_c0_g6_i1.p1 TRINITY_DN4582_c0_g6~~TRINITY_DN4582_c0_g6_i1.p1  ORF type:complete len:188 (+),score=2.81 TRINITY_DN4582_c0_g6_i1:82-645(+)